MRRTRRRAGRGFLAVLLGLAWGTLVLFPPLSEAQTPAGTVIPNLATVVYQASPGSYSSPSNTTAATVDAAAAVTIAPPRSGVAYPGTSVSYRHTVTNAGNAADAFDLTGASTLGLAIAYYASDSVTLLPDTNGNGIPDTGPVPAGGNVDVVVRLTVPVGAPPGSSDNTTVRAASGADPATFASVGDVTGIPSLWDPLVKTVDPPGQVTPGTVVTYTNVFGNAGPVAATNAVITDVLDANLLYIPGSATAPPGLPGAAVAYDPVARTVAWTIPLVPAGYVGQVSFRATIDPNTPSDTTVTNRIALVSDQSPAPRTSNVVTSVVVEQPLRITKRAAQATAEIGDPVAYVVRVENGSALLAADNVVVVDDLPHGFRYVKGSATIDGAAAPDPAGGTRPAFPLGLVPAGAARTITYRVLVSVDASLGDGVNAARAFGASPAGNPLRAGPARAKVLVREGVLNSKAIVLGRVFVDRNGDTMPGDDEPGVPGARIYLEDGTYADTDREGRYSIYGVAPGEHVLKLDRRTLPPGLSPVPLTNAFAGDGGSQFVSVPFGGPARGDFGLAGEIRQAAPAVPVTGKPLEKVFTFTAGGSAAPPIEVQVQWMPATPEILEPANGSALARRWTDVVVRVPEGAEHRLQLNGEAVPQTRIGKTIHESARRLFVYQYVGVPLEGGPNTIVLETREPGGGVVTREATVSAPGTPARLVLDPARATVPAGGRTPVRFTVTLLDRWGRPTSDEAVVTVITAKGAVAGTDPDPVAPGFQIRVRNGSAPFDLLAAGQTGSDKVRVLLGNALEAEADVYFAAEMRDWVVAGVGSARAGDRSVSGDTARVRDRDDFEDGPYHDERLAVFAKGTLLDRYLFTGAFDTGKEKAEGLFQRSGPDKYYPVYGDESAIGYDAESRRKLFLKVERDRNSVLFGDFHTGLTANELTRYDRTFNGVLADIDTGVLTLKAFATETAQVLVKDEIPGNGTSGYFFLSRTPVIENSEKVRIEVRDRYHPEIVVRSIVKSPYLDYTLDPDTGALLFKESVPSLDPALNPVTIVALYEAENGGDAFYTYGGRAGARLGGRAEAGVTTIVEDKGIRTETLVGADAAVRIADRVRLKGEYAASDTDAKGTGSAWKLELGGDAAWGLRYGAYYRDVDAAFVNPSMTGNETGTTKYGVKADYELSKASAVGVESFVQENRPAGTKLTQHAVGGKYRFGRAALEGGYKFLGEERTTPSPVDADSHLLYAGVSGPIAKKLAGSIRRDQLIGSGQVPGYPTRTEAGLTYQVTEGITARLTQEIQERGEKRHATVLGLESKVTESTTLSSRYSVEDTISGSRAQATIGLNNRWEPRPKLTLSTRAERIQFLDGADGASGTALALAAEYLPDNSYKATGRYEIRLGDVETTNLFSIGAAIRLADGLSLLPKMTFWNRDAGPGSETLYDGLVGLAWRSKGSPAVHLLDTLRYKVDRATSALASRDRQSLITSTEASWRVSPRWTLLGKYAGKYVLDSENGARFSAYTDLLVAGVAYDLTDRWDVGVQGKLMNQYQAKVHSLGALARTGYRIFKNLYGGVGYSFSRLDDRDLSGAEYKSHGPFVEIRFKFDEETLRLSPRRGEAGGRAGAPPSAAPPAAIPPPAADNGAVRAERAPPRFAISGAAAQDPLEVLGSIDGFSFLVGGARVPLPEADVAMREDNLELRDGRLPEPARFAVTLGTATAPRSWRLVVRDAGGRPVRVIAGEGRPPPEIVWDGLTDAGTIVGAGDGYDYQLELADPEGNLFASPRRAFGVNGTSRVVMAVTAGGFGEGSAALGPEAKRVLREAARLIRKHPDGKVVVEGHTDSPGREDRNLALSARRAEAAAAFLVGGGIPRSRIEVRGYGGARPAAGNDSPGGRRRNRRVEIRGEFLETRRAAVLDQYRTAPSVRVNGRPLDIDPDGRFEARIPGTPERIELDMVSPRGKAVRAAIPVPRVEVHVPDNAVLPPPSAETDRGASPGGAGGPEGVRSAKAIRWRLTGRTERENEVIFRGTVLETGSDGSFSTDVDLQPGENVLGLIVRNAAGCARLVRVKILVSPAPGGRGPG